MKNIFLALSILTLVSCNQKIDNNVSNSNAPDDKNELIVKPELKPIDLRSKYNFVDSIIPQNLKGFIYTIDSNYRLPTKADYDDYYFNDFAKGYDITNLPFFCSGYYNQDSILDYSLVLIKDSTQQIIFAFNSVGESFTHHIITKRDLVESEKLLFKTVSFNIRTNSEKKIETIDTIYTIKFDGILVNDMYESDEFCVGWNPEESNFSSLYFD